MYKIMLTGSLGNTYIHTYICKKKPFAWPVLGRLSNLDSFVCYMVPVRKMEATSMDRESPRGKQNTPQHDINFYALGKLF